MAHRMVMCLLATAFMSGCELAVGQENVPKHEQILLAVPTEGRCKLSMYIDWSLSPDSTAMHLAVERVVRSLPRITKSSLTTAIKVFAFDQDGWLCREIYSRVFQSHRVGIQNPVDLGEVAYLYQKPLAEYMQKVQVKEYARFWEHFRRALGNIMGLPYSHVVVVHHSVSTYGLKVRIN